MVRIEGGNYASLVYHSTYNCLSNMKVAGILSCLKDHMCRF